MSNIELIKIEEFETGFQRLRNARLELSGGLELYEYKSAIFTLENLKQSEVSPSTFYALNSLLEFQQYLEKLFLETLNIDLFNLPGIIYFKLNEKVYGMVPPIIEVYEETDGKDNYALQDGVHRFLLAAQQDKPIKSIVIKNKNCNKEYLPYAFTNTWKEVGLYNAVPLPKKNYRREEKYSFMRPLQSIFDLNLIHSWADYGR